MKHLPLLGLAWLAAATSAAAVQVVDQENLPGRIDFNTQDPRIEWQQTIVTGVSGRLDAIELWSHQAPGSFLVSVHRGAAWQGGTPAFTLAVSPAPDSSFSVDLRAARLRFLAGDALTLSVKGLGPGLECCGLWGTDQNHYAPGDLLLDGSTRFTVGLDLAFRTYVTPIPEPATTLSITLGLIAFALRPMRTMVRGFGVHRRRPAGQPGPRLEAPGVR